jgi:hypothetical protein
MSLEKRQSETGLVRETKWGQTPVSFQAWFVRPQGPCFIGISCKAKRNGCFSGCHWESAAPRPPRIRVRPGGTRKINGLGAEAHPVSHLVALANETDRSTPSSDDHPSASHSPCDLGAKLHSPQKKGIPSGVSPKIVSLVRKGLTDRLTTPAWKKVSRLIDR